MYQPTALPWLMGMTQPNLLLNAIMTLTHRSLHLAGHNAISKLKQTEWLDTNIKTNDHVQYWNSVFSGISVIANRITRRHRDSGGAFSWPDLLLSSGTHKTARFHLNDINARLSYPPGTVVAVCGGILSHSVPEWSGGERVCVAHFMRKEVHHRLGVFSPSWCQQVTYKRLMHRPFLAEQERAKQKGGSGASVKR
jgi:hypothetical protein